MREEVIRFGPGRGLVGIVTKPPPGMERRDLPGVVLLNAGLLHRVGPNRVYVKIARALACEGFTVLRFDFSGLGDSRPRADHLPYVQSAPSEAQEAMEWLAQHAGAQRFILAGHCAGAAISFLVAGKDARVVGAALLNMEGGDDQWAEYDRLKKESRLYAASYGAGALSDRERWAKLFSGRAHYGKIASNLWNGVLLNRLRALSFKAKQTLRGQQSEERAAQAERVQTYLTPVLDRNVALHFIHSEGSTGLAQLRAGFGGALDQLAADGRIELTIIPQCDHLFTLLARQRALCETITTWARAHFVEAAEPASAPGAQP